jgi:hypothetical protein
MMNATKQLKRFTIQEIVKAIKEGVGIKVLEQMLEK